MKKKFSFQFYFWFIFFSLLFIPVANSFIVNIKKLYVSYIDNIRFKQVQSSLICENKKLIHKLKDYKSIHGLKTLTKERLNKVEDGESLIKFNNDVSVEIKTKEKE